MAHTSGDVLSKASLYGQKTGNSNLFFPMNLIHQLFISEPTPSKVTHKVQHAETPAQTSPSTWSELVCPAPSPVSRIHAIVPITNYMSIEIPEAKPRLRRSLLKM